MGILSKDFCPLPILQITFVGSFGQGFFFPCLPLSFDSFTKIAFVDIITRAVFKRLSNVTDLNSKPV